MGTEAFAELEDEEQFADPELLIPQGIPTKEILWEERVRAINGDGGYDSGDENPQANEMVNAQLPHNYPMGYPFPPLYGHFPIPDGLHANGFVVPNSHMNGPSQSLFVEPQLFQAHQLSSIIPISGTSTSESSSFSSINGEPSTSTTQASALINSQSIDRLPSLDLAPAQEEVFDLNQYLHLGDENVRENGVEHGDEGENYGNDTQP
jgi:hypothetical protein